MSLLSLGLGAIFQITPALFYLCVTPDGARQSRGGERTQAPWSGSGARTGDARPTLLGQRLLAAGSRRRLLVRVCFCASPWRVRLHPSRSVLSLSPWLRTSHSLWRGWASSGGIPVSPALFLWPRFAVCKNALVPSSRPIYYFSWWFHRVLWEQEGEY